MANNNYRKRKPKNAVERQKERDLEAVTMMRDAMEEAQTKEQPFNWQNQDGAMEVVGDVSDIDAEKDYVVQFRYPTEYASQFADYDEMDDGTIVVSRSFNSVKLTPRKARRIKQAASAIIVWFTTYENTTGLRVQTVAELADMYVKLTPELWDAIEEVVQVVLGITDFDMEYTTDESVIAVGVDIVRNNSGFFQ